MSIANTYIIIVKKMSGSKVEVEAEAENANDSQTTKKD